MKTLVFLIVIVIALLVIGVVAMIRREAGTRKRYIRNSPKRYEDQHRGYPVMPPSRDSIAAKAPPQRPRPDPAPKEDPRMQFGKPLISLEKYYAAHGEYSPDGDQDKYDQASAENTRNGLQKVAYEMVGSRYDEATKARFKQDMTAFAADDPMVHLIARRVQQLVLDNPGQLQSKIYRHFPEFTKEQVRYGLYFADELGWVRRQKKGNSYQLFPIGLVYE